MSKISELSDGGSLQSTDYLIAVRSGGNVKVRPNGAVSGTTGQFSTSLNVDGTVTADGLTVDGDVLITTNTATNPFVVSRVGNTTESLQITFDDSNTILTSEQDEAGRYGGYVFNSKNAGTTIKRMEIAHTSGDISFYDSAGSSQSFFWDASAESLGIGTTSPSFATGTGLEIQRTTATATLRLEYTGSNAFELSSEQNTVTYNSVSSKPHVFEIGSAEVARIDSSGNVGIGTTSPAYELDVSTSSGEAYIRVDSATDQDGGFRISENGTNKWLIYNDASANALSFYDNSNVQERMRIDSSGNLLVGKSTSDVGATAGFEWYDTGNVLLLTRSAGQALSVNRLTSDGDLTTFRKDGSTIGSIGIKTSRFYFAQTGGSGISMSGVNLLPTDGTGAPNDNTNDIGFSSFRYDDIYATNGTIQTSDANEKQDIRDLSEAEARVAQEAKALLKAFRWKDSVAEKGDEARIHFGIIAQDLQAAFEAEGLDAGRYAMFIHSTWTDEETGEERSRMGVRYSDLLAFIIAAL